MEAKGRRGLKKLKIAVIGGTGTASLLQANNKTRVGTPYGPSPTITIGQLGGVEVAFMPRHGEMHASPPHKINYRANIWALHAIGVERILAMNATGAINPDYGVGGLVIPNDFLDFTWLRSRTFYDKSPVTHIDLTAPYCPELRRTLIDAARGKARQLWDEAVYVCTEGPRYETPAEIRMFRTLGGDIIGMTGIPEVVLARELEMCYASICFVSNMAAGMQKRVDSEEVLEIGKRKEPILRRILREAVKRIPERRRCPCSHALEGARL